MLAGKLVVAVIRWGEVNAVQDYADEGSMGVGNNPKVLAARGLRMSTSSRHVSACSAKAEAKLTDSRVLPSPAVDETTRMTKLDCFAFASRMEDFKLRTASACGDQGLANTNTMSRFCAGRTFTGNNGIGLCHPNRFGSME